MARTHTDIADSSPINHQMESHPLFTRREMLGATGMASLAALAGMAPLAGRAAGAASQDVQARIPTCGSGIFVRVTAGQLPG